MVLRFVLSQWTPFVEALQARRDVETAGLVFAERLPGTEVLVVRDMLLVPEAGYLVRQLDQLRIDPIAFNRLVRPARDHGWSVFTIHTHPNTTRPWFSAADDLGDARLVPSLFAQMTGPHGSIVVASDSGDLAARVWTSATGCASPLHVRFVGQTLKVLPPAKISESTADGASGPWFARQRLALGADGQQALRSLHIAIVGLGGTGSVVLTQLAHLGVGRLTLVDPDQVESSNVSRIIGATYLDSGLRWKVEVGARYVEQLGFGTELHAFRGALGTDVPLDTLAGCDIVVSCVDTHTPRALLNRLAYAYAIPVIDLGSAFRVDALGRVVEGAGRVVVVGPERPCLACWGHLDPVRLRHEALSSRDRIRLAAEGYIDGADIPQPSVIAFNTMVAGAAVVELLRVATAFAGADDPPSRLSFDFRAGTVRRNRLMADAACRICGAPLGSPEGPRKTS